MLLTFWHIIVVIGSLWFIGLPVAMVLALTEDDNETLWIIAPFTGLAVIILVLQNLIYLDVPIRLSTLWLWIGACLLWGWLIKSKRLKPALKTIPRVLFISALGVYLIQGLGLLIVGAKYYVGRAWYDQLNYTAITQFLVDFPFSFSFSEAEKSPYLFQAICHKFDRIGQSVFHGFMTASTFTDAKTTFEPVILLLPLLTVLAVYYLGWRLSLPFRSRLNAALIAGILPCVTIVHLESFLSQALAIPLLLVWPSFLSEAIDRLSWRWMLASSLILAAGTSIYTEFYIIYLGIGTLMAVICALRRFKEKFLIMILWAALICTALLINPGFIRGIANIFKRIANPNVLSGVYPWAYSLEGLTRLWLGDLYADLAGYWPYILGVVSIGLLLTAYSGIVFTLVKRKDGITQGIAALAMLPLIIMFKGSQYKYQFYKILLSVSPLMPLGIALFLKTVSRRHLYYQSFMRFVIPVAVFILIAVSDMVLRSGLGHTREEIGRGGAHKLIAPSTRAVQDVLSSMHDRDLYIFYYDNFHSGKFINGWLTYFARQNRVLAINPLVDDISPNPHLCGAKQRSFKPSSDPFLLTSTRVEPFKDYLVWSYKPYYLYEFPLKEWPALSWFITPVQIEASIERFGPYDLMKASEAIHGDGRLDAVIKFVMHTSGNVKSIEIRNTDGRHSVWDTIPRNGHVSMGIADPSRPDELLNRQDGSIGIDVRNQCDLLLYVADNGSIKAGKTNYVVTVNFTDGRVGRSLVKRKKL